MFTLSELDSHLSVMSKLVFFMVTGILIAVNIDAGPVLSPDTWTYSKWADDLIHNNFDYLVFFQSVSFVSPIYLYSFPITVFAMAKVFSHEYWEVFVFVLNMICIPLIVYLLNRILSRCEVNRYIIAFFPLMFLLSSDYALWPRYILSDTFFCALLLWNIYCVVVGCEKKGWLWSVCFVISVLLLLLSRPSSPPVVVVLLLFYFFPQVAKNFYEIRCFVKVNLLFAFIVLGMFAVLVDANISGGLQIEQLNFISAMVKNGVVIHDRPETFISYTIGYLHVIEVLFLRFIYFFAPFVMAFSIVHIVINLLFFAMIGLFIAVGEACVENVRAIISPVALKVRGMLFSLIIAITTFQSMTLIDYDWRYRYPVIGLLIILAMLALDMRLKLRLRSSRVLC